MSVKTLLDRIQPYAKGWSRSTGNKSLLALMQLGLDDMWDYDGRKQVWIGTGNQGFPPYLKTVAGTYKYAINSTNLAESITVTLGGSSRSVRCKRVLRVFVDLTQNDYTGKWVGEPFLYHSVNPYGSATSRIMCGVVPVRESIDALENNEAYVVFPDDPGTHTDLYFCEFIWEPPRLTAETIPLPFPTIFEPALRDYMMGEVQFLENGTPNELQARWENYWKPKFQDLVRGDLSDNNQTMVREC